MYEKDNNLTSCSGDTLHKVDVALIRAEIMEVAQTITRKDLQVLEQVVATASSKLEACAWAYAIGLSGRLK